MEVLSLIKAASFKEDTLLGDYLRAIRQLQENPKAPEWEHLSDLTERTADGSWIADLSDSEIRASVLQEAAEMGAGLLRGERII